MDCKIIYLNNFKDPHRLTTVHVLQIGETNVPVSQHTDDSLQFPSGVRVNKHMNITASNNHLSEIVLAINAAKVIKANTPKNW